jgi:hypothetical protein
MHLARLVELGPDGRLVYVPISSTNPAHSRHMGPFQGTSATSAPLNGSNSAVTIHSENENAVAGHTWDPSKESQPLSFERF